MAMPGLAAPGGRRRRGRARAWRRCAFSNDAVGEDLDRAGPQPADGAGAAPLDQVGQLGPAVLGLPAQGGHGPAGEPAGLGRGPVGGQHVRFDGGVLPGGDAQAVQVAPAPRADRRARRSAGRAPAARPRDQVAPAPSCRVRRWAAVRVPLDPARRRVGRARVDPGQLQGAAVDPGAVAVGRLEQHRPVGRPPRPARPGAGRRCRRRPSTQPPPSDPGGAGVVGGVAGHGGRVGRRLDLVEVALGQLQAAGGGVDVGVLEPGQDQPAVQRAAPGSPARAGSASSRSGPAAATRPARTATASAQGTGRVGGVHRRPHDQQVWLGTVDLAAPRRGDGAGAGGGRPGRASRPCTTSTVAAMAE